MSACEECWSKAVEIANRTGQGTADIYRHLVREGRSHPHGVPRQQVDVRGMTCAEAVVATNMPCRGACTHNTDSMAGPVSPSVIVDPDCFRMEAS